MNLSLTKFISIIYRQGQRYYDRELVPHGIGCGQQFFYCASMRTTGSVCTIWPCWDILTRGL